jgi:mannose-6-phosphate isomerase-like protein (cupin superfamily)
MSEVFITNIEDATLNNKNYRKVLYTSTNLHGMQLVVMSLKPSEEIGMEKHTEADQFIRIEQGEAVVQIGKTKKDIYKLDANDSILIPAGTWHNVINSNDHYPLKLYTLYTPPQHKDKLIQKLKPKMD